MHNFTKKCAITLLTFRYLLHTTDIILLIATFTTYTTDITTNCDIN